MNLYNFIYKGLKLPEYCKLNGIDFELVKKIYIRRRRYTASNNMTIYDLIDDIIRNIEKYSLNDNYKVMYHNEPLYYLIASDYSEICYENVVRFINDNLSNDPSLNIDDLVDEYLSTNHTKYCRYFVIPKLLSDFYKRICICSDEPESLLTHCSVNNIRYSTIVTYINRQKVDKKNRRVDKSKFVIQLLEEYARNNEEELINNKNKYMFEKLKHTDDISEISELCNYFGFSISYLVNIVKKGFSFYQALSLLWYFSDYKDMNNNPSLSSDRLLDITAKIESLNERDYKIKCSIYEAYGIYKSFFDIKNFPINIAEPFIIDLFRSICNLKGINYTNDLYMSHKINLINRFIELINYTTINDENKLISYLNSNMYNYINELLGVGSMGAPKRKTRKNEKK